MNNSYLVGTGECLGFCSIVPKVGEEHMFGDRLVKFLYQVGKYLFFVGQYDVNTYNITINCSGDSASAENIAKLVKQQIKKGDVI